MPSGDFMSLHLQGNTDVQRALRSLANPAAVRRPLLMLAGGRMKQHIRTTFDRQRDPVTGQPWQPVVQFGDDPDPMKKILQHNAGSGLIGGLMAAVPEMDGDSVSIGPPSTIPYANIHQYGGIVRPTRAKNLAMPITKAARTAANARRWWSQQGGRAFVYRARTGKKNLFLATTGDDGRVQLHWLLKKEVTIPQRRYIGWGQEQIDDISTQFIKYIAKAARREGLDNRE